MKHKADITFTRNRYDKVKNYYANKGLAPALSQIRIEQKLINGQGDYRFDLKKEILNPNEQNLKRNDLFVCLGLGIFLSVGNPDKPGTESLLPYALIGNENPDVPGFKTNDINALYNGKLYISTGSVVNIEDMPTSLFKKVPNRQPSSTGQIEFDLLETLHTMPEELVFAGTQDHKIQITFPTFASSDYSASTEESETKMVFIALGYKVPGGTAEQYKNDPSNPYRFAI